jgi:hypothetical protein
MMSPESDTRFADPMSRAPAGYGLTQPRGKWAWDKPARFSDPNEAVGYIIDQIEKPAVTERYIKLMLAGFTVEELTNSITISGFATGNFTPDVAELIKPAIATYLMGMADENQLPVRVFSTPDGNPPEDDELDDITILDFMKKRNPKVFTEFVDLNNKIQSDIREEILAEKNKTQGFLGVSEEEEVEE